VEESIDGMRAEKKLLYLAQALNLIRGTSVRSLSNLAEPKL
jgi:hypothetical protein